MEQNKIINRLGGLNKAIDVVNFAPKFIHQAINPSEIFFNPRTKQYIERSRHSATIQAADEELFRSTMPYQSSFYDECINFNEIRKIVASLV